MSASVPTITSSRKPSPAFYANLDFTHGVLTMSDDGAMWFRDSETDALTAITPANVNFLTVNGEVGICEVMKQKDLRMGGYAAIACNRTMAVA